MTDPAAVSELPDRDPGLPRFLSVLALVACAVAAAAVARPPWAGRAPTAGAVAQAHSQADSGPGGAELFVREGCGECHSVSSSSTALGPSLAGALDRASSRIADPTYAGSARTAQEYLWEATVDHCRDPLPGYTCPELLLISTRLSADEVERIVAYLGGLDDAP